MRRERSPADEAKILSTKGILGWILQWFKRCNTNKGTVSIMGYSKEDLTFFQTKELVDELAKRHDALVIAGIRFIKTNGQYEVLRFHNGHRLVCLGQISNMQSLINKEENDFLHPSK